MELRDTLAWLRWCHGVARVYLSIWGEHVVQCATYRTHASGDASLEQQYERLGLIYQTCVLQDRALRVVNEQTWRRPGDARRHVKSCSMGCSLYMRIVTATSSCTVPAQADAALQLHLHDMHITEHGRLCNAS